LPPRISLFSSYDFQKKTPPPMGEFSLSERIVLAAAPPCGDGVLRWFGQADRRV
jgi:hypothetical protein